MNHQVLGSLRPTVGNAVGLTTQFSGRYPMRVQQKSKLVSIPVPFRLLCCEATLQGLRV